MSSFDAPSVKSLGVTGTRHGLSAAQRQVLGELLGSLPPIKEFHHGACVGVDEQVALAVAVAFPEAMHVVRPGLVREEFWSHVWKAMDVVSEVSDRIHPLERNRLIVDAADLMLAFPAEQEPQEKGGTWYTVRYSLRVGVPIVVVLPDGSLLDDPFVDGGIAPLSAASIDLGLELLGLAAPQRVDRSRTIAE